MADNIWNLGNLPGNRPDDGMGHDVMIEIDPAGQTTASDEGIVTELPDGSITVNLAPPVSSDDTKHYDNLAMRMDQGELGRIGEQLIDAIEADDQSRAEWLQTRARGLELLGLKLEEPKGDVGSTSAPVEGMSVVRHPVLLEAVLMAWANARAELLPADGPVKVKDVGQRSPQSDELADNLEKDFNFYLTKKAKEYYPDTDRMLLMTVFGGSGFKKVYMDPMRRRPVSESVDAQDLIVNNAATDLANAGRITHRIKMRPAVMKRMKFLGIYRDVELTPPTPQNTVVDLKEANIEGIDIQSTRQEDRDHTIYETYCELDLDRFAPSHLRGKGLLLPYRVTIDRDSREILELRRNWDEDNEDCDPRTTFVHYPYIRGFGLYGWGLLHLLGNSAAALTATWREALDAGMFANFPGFLVAKLAARQQTNEMRVAAGSGVVVDTQGMPINQAVMPLPYKDITPGLLGMMDKVAGAAQRIGGVTEMKIGEGKQDAPVGTTIALIEQATRVESAVHKNMHQAQSEEFELLLDLFREQPDAFWRGNKRPATQWDEQQFIAAIDTYGIVPVADPNTPSHLHRIMKATAVKQLQAASPALYDPKAVDMQVLRIMGWENPESLFAPPQAPQAQPPDPRIAKVQTDAAAKLDELRTRAAISQAEIGEKTKDRELKEKIAMIDLARTLAVHPEAEALAERTVSKNIPTTPQ
jgi:hypothetical protein